MGLAAKQTARFLPAAFQKAICTARRTPRKHQGFSPFLTADDRANNRRPACAAALDKSCGSIKSRQDAKAAAGTKRTAATGSARQQAAAKYIAGKAATAQTQ